MIYFIAMVSLIIYLIKFIWRFIMEMDKIDTEFIILTLETIIVVLLALRVLEYI